VRTNTPRYHSFGHTLVEVLVSILLGGMVLGAATKSFTASVKGTVDMRSMSRTQEQARAILDLLSTELRLLGAGMPLGQADFPITATTFNDTNLPILLDATQYNIKFRKNERGIQTSLSSNYTPAATSLSIPVLSSSGFIVGDPVYISDMVLGGSFGMWGKVASMSSGNINLNSEIYHPAGITFTAGSIVEPVSLIEYNSPADGSGVTRDTGLDTTILAPNSSFKLTYLDQSGTAIALPLTADIIGNSLSAIDIEVTVGARAADYDGEFYEATVGHRVALRNLITVR
jgi:type II secretory pathway pseudopilin PulG